MTIDCKKDRNSRSAASRATKIWRWPRPFSEVFNANLLEEHIGPLQFAQDNHSLSQKKHRSRPRWSSNRHGQVLILLRFIMWAGRPSPLKSSHKFGRSSSERMIDAQEQIYRAADHRDAQGARCAYRLTGCRRRRYGASTAFGMRPSINGEPSLAG